MVKRPGFELSLVIKALDQGWQIDEEGQLLLSNDTRNVYVRMLTRTAKKIAELEEQLGKLEEQLKEQEAVKVEKRKEEAEWNVCSNCGGHLIHKWSYCPSCGRAVKWE